MSPAREFWLGIHHPNWLRDTTVPLMVSRVALDRYKTPPKAAGPWFMDSGGFTEIDRNGAWTVPAAQFAFEVARYAGLVGNMRWCSPQDWMCEPHMLKRTGLDVDGHQARTVENLLELRDLAPKLPWVPVLQGWETADYERCMARYADAGVDLAAEPMVGIGSVCRRQDTAAATEIVRMVTDAGIAAHGFGVKVTGLTTYGDLLASSDSMAWSYRARKGQVQLPGCTHRNCANCLTWALEWRKTKVMPLIEDPVGEEAPYAHEEARRSA